MIIQLKKLERLNMYHTNEFNQIMKLFPQDIFQNSVNLNPHSEKYRTHTPYNHLVSMLFCQISGANSLRELEASFNSHQEAHYHLKTSTIKRSTLSYANARADSKPFIDVLLHLMNLAAPKMRKSLSEFINIIDSSPISLTENRFSSWSKNNKSSRIQGLKLHIGINTDAETISEFEISNANKNDITIAKKWDLKPAQMYIFDKGYYDYNWWHEIVEIGSSFVTRSKKDAALNIVEQLEIKGENVINDEKVKFRYKNPRGGKKNLYTNNLRRVTIKRKDKKTPIILLTNRFDLSAEEIGFLYKERWQVELFFKWIKQNLKIKKFIGNSKNSVKIQIITALIAYLLLSIYKKACNIKCSLHLFLIKIKTRLFHAPYDKYHRDKYNKNSKLSSNQMEFQYV